jgi:hypothetical protein
VKFDSEALRVMGRIADSVLVGNKALLAIASCFSDVAGKIDIDAMLRVEGDDSWITNCVFYSKAEKGIQCR